MEQKLNETLRENEKVLWSGKPEFKAFGATHKTAYAAKCAVVAAIVIGFLAYYFMGVKAGTITFKAMVLVLTAVVAAVPLVLEWVDVSKMKKTVYAMTDSRMISIVDGAVNSVEYAKVDAYKFVEDADGQVSLMCGTDMINQGPRTCRTNAVFGTRMRADGSACERFVLYAIPEADEVKKLAAKLL